MRAMRPALAVLLAVSLMISSVLNHTAHASSAQIQTSVTIHVDHASSDTHMSEDCAGHDLVKVSSSDHHHHTGHHGDHTGADCNCICHSCARLAEHSGLVLVKFPSTLVASKETVLLKSITIDLDDPPIISALS